MKLFELFATLSLDTSQFSSGVQKATAIGANLANTLNSKVTAGTIALGNAMYDVAKRGVNMLANLSKTAVSSAAEVRAENAQFESTFKDMGDAANSVFQGIGRETNILSTRLRTVGTKAFAQFTGAGMESVDAMAAMERYTKLAADAAAYYDISLEDADTRLRSFLRGNTEAGDAIGLFTSESQRNSYAVEMYGKKWAKLTEEQRNMLLLKVAEDIYEQSGAMGQAAREGSNWANVTANLQEVWRQTLGVIGSPIVDALTPLVEKVTAKLQDEKVQTAINDFATKVGEIAGATFENLMTLLDVITGDTSSVQEGSALDNVLTFLTDIGNWIAQNEGVVTGFFAALAISIAAVNWPIALFGIAVALVASNWETIKTAVTAAWDAVVGFFTEDVPEAFWQMIEKIETWWNEKVVAPINNAITALQNFFGYDGKSITVSAQVQAAADIGAGAAELWGSDWAGALATENAMTFNQADSVAGSVGQTIGNWLSSLFGRATGQDYVPYNNYIARLHEGEAVLTKAEATAWRRGETTGSVDADSLATAISSAVSSAFSNLKVYMDGEKVGDMVTDQVSRNLASAAWEERYST